MNMYSTLTLKFLANANSTPPPSVPVVKVSECEVEMSQLPQPAAVASTLVDDRSLHRNKRGATFDIEQGLTPSVS